MVDQRKTVLQLCHGYAPPFDDVARQWRVLFDESEYHVVTVFLVGEADSAVEKLVGGTVVFLGYQSKDIRGLKRQQIADVKKLHQQYQFTAVVAHRYKSMYIATHLPDIKVYGVCHAFGVFQNWTRRFYAGLKKKNLWLVGVSDAVSQDIRTCCPNFPSKQIMTVHNHIDVQRVKERMLGSAAARQHFGYGENDLVFVTIGRLHPDKDQTTLIKGFAKAFRGKPNVKLAIIGEGKLRPPLEKLIDTSGMASQVTLHGRVPQAVDYLQGFDCFVLTSDYEPFGMVLLEAIAAGLPVISADTGGPLEILGEKGLFFKTGNHSELADCLSVMASNSTENSTDYAAYLSMRLEKKFDDSAVKKQFCHFLSVVL